MLTPTNCVGIHFLLYLLISLLYVDLGYMDWDCACKMCEFVLLLTHQWSLFTHQMVSTYLLYD